MARLAQGKTGGGKLIFPPNGLAFRVEVCPMTGLASCDMPRLIGMPVHRRGLGFDAHALGVIVGPVNSRSVPTVVDVEWRTGERTSCRREALELVLSPTTNERIEPMPTKAQRDRYLKKAAEVVKARIAELNLTEKKIADELGCSKGTLRNTVHVSQSPVAPKPERMRALSTLLGWAPDALELLQEKGIMPELAEDDEVPAAPAPKAAPAARKRTKVVPEEALAPPAPPAPFVKPGSLRRDITKLQEANEDKDQAIHALQREAAELRAMLADVCGQLGIDGPKSRKTA